MGHDGDSFLLALRPLTRDLLVSKVMCGPNVSTLIPSVLPASLTRACWLFSINRHLSDQPSIHSPTGVVLYLRAQFWAWQSCAGGGGSQRPTASQHHCLHVIDGG